MRVALFTSFPPRFVEDKIRPALLRRGVEIVLIEEAKRAGHIELWRYSLDMILHMTEMGSHAFSARLTAAASKAGLTIRALSRKEASWSFLPAPTAASEEAAVQIPQDIVEKVKAAQPAAKADAAQAAIANQAREAQEAKDMLALFEQENAQLKQTIAGQQATLDVYKRDLDAAVERIEKHARKAGLRSAIYLLADAGVLTPEDMVVKLRAIDEKT